MTDCEKELEEHRKKVYHVQIDDGLETWNANSFCPTYVEPADGIYLNRFNGPNEMNIEGYDFYYAWSKGLGPHYKRRYGPAFTTDKGRECYGKELTGNDGLGYYGKV